MNNVLKHKDEGELSRRKPQIELGISGSVNGLKSLNSLAINVLNVVYLIREFSRLTTLMEGVDVKGTPFTRIILTTPTSSIN